jgi:hypothetical protein
LARFAAHVWKNIKKTCFAAHVWKNNKKRFGAKQIKNMCDIWRHLATFGYMFLQFGSKKRHFGYKSPSQGA